jgi:hypothetical protein
MALPPQLVFHSVKPFDDEIVFFRELLQNVLQALFALSCFFLCGKQEPNEKARERTLLNQSVPKRFFHVLTCFSLSNPDGSGRAVSLGAKSGAAAPHEKTPFPLWKRRRVTLWFVVGRS